ncbi:MAG TPA: GNAT family N-acetyltransferase [Tepidisphaeraceae bacterium]|nr:GNAT family N-acetyltransferase [Tepidisphaeraceae bacterium]
MSEQLPPIPVKIRTYEPRDREVVKHLYVEGLIGGHIAPNDTGLDIEDVQGAYLSSDGNHFWVAENMAGEVVGMIAVQIHRESEAEIRRLRVRQDHRRRGIGAKLLETAIKWCQEMGCLKVTLDTYMEREPALKLFEKFKFKHSRTRDVSGKSLLYFYLDLYSGDRPPQKKE